MNARYPFIAERAGHRCEYCHAPEAIFNFAFEVEHIVPSALQGPADDANLALACRACNLHKADQLSGLDESTGTSQP
jgi:5-methylcytosine-specific restriction endonuclease McrA